MLKIRVMRGTGDGGNTLSRRFPRRAAGSRRTTMLTWTLATLRFWRGPGMLLLSGMNHVSMSMMIALKTTTFARRGGLGSW